MFDRTKDTKIFLIKIRSKINPSSCEHCYKEVARISITSEKADDKIVNHAGKGRGGQHVSVLYLEQS